MKRFRVFGSDFDTRVHALTLEIRDEWDEGVKRAHVQNRERTLRWLISAFGEDAAEHKRQNFIDLGSKPLSILAFHNVFFEQTRRAFIVGAYYPALTGACALGERILNHLVLLLRDDYKLTPHYKRVHNKDSFDDWNLAIDALEAWAVLLPEVVTDFRRLRDRRNEAIHFRPEVDHNDRALALAALQTLGSIIGTQFSALGPQPWFITSVPGEMYIRKDWADRPFIRRFYRPNAALVGPRHAVVSVLTPWAVKDTEVYEERPVTDEEFCELRKAFLAC